MRLRRFTPLIAMLLPFGIVAHAGEPVRIAAAVSLKKSLEQIARNYAADTGEQVEFTFGASGQLLTQAKNGAPIDVFISAGPQQIDALEKASLVQRHSRRAVVSNKLVVVEP